MRFVRGEHRPLNDAQTVDVIRRVQAFAAAPIEWRMTLLPAPPPHVEKLIHAIVAPESAAGFNDDDWDLIVRTAGTAELLGTLHSRLGRAGVLSVVPAAPRLHLAGAHAFYVHRAQMARYLLRGLHHALRGMPEKLVLLKGAAYVVQGLPFSVGRMFDDVDLMVSRSDLDAVEARLQQAGWLSEKPDAYDQHYYRAWAHELPPMRHPRFLLQLDVHHTILPVTGRLKPDAAKLIEAAIPVAGEPWCVLSPADQLLHVAVHLFQDSDCTNRLRELVDIDALLRAHAGAGLDEMLPRRAALHGLGRPLWYALRYAQAWLGTPVSPALARAIGEFAPGPLARGAMDRLVHRAIFPPHPDSRPARRSPFAHRILEGRAVWLRMPPWLLIYHAAMKVFRSAGRRPVDNDPLR